MPVRMTSSRMKRSLSATFRTCASARAVSRLSFCMARSYCSRSASTFIFSRCSHADTNTCDMFHEEASERLDIVYMSHICIYIKHTHLQIHILRLELGATLAHCGVQLPGVLFQLLHR